MFTPSFSGRTFLGFAVLALVAGGAVANSSTGGGSGQHYYVPFTVTLPDGRAQGLWLENTGQPGSAPVQVTSQFLDGAGPSNAAVLDDWSYDSVQHEAVNEHPSLLVYGLGKRLYSLNLANGGKPQLFSNGTYDTLCSVVALDGQPYSSNGSFVEVFVIPVGWTGDCATGFGVQTWIIPANANANYAPTIEAHYWRVLGAFSDPNTGAFVSWIVWNSVQVEADDKNFVGRTTLLSGLPAGFGPSLVSQDGQTAFLLSTTSDGLTRTDSLFRLTPTGGAPAASFSYLQNSPCAGLATGSITDLPNGVLAQVEPTDTGYAVYALPLAGGVAQAIYADPSGTACGASAGDSVSAVHVVLGETNLLSGVTRVIGVSENDSADQTPAVLAAGDANTIVLAHAIVKGHVWIDVFTTPAGGSTQYSEVVADGDGTQLENYPDARLGGDGSVGFLLAGTPALDRGVMFLFMPTGGLGCNGATLTAVNASSFVMTNVSGVPLDACTTSTSGWRPLSLGNVQEPAGNSAVAMDPVGGRLYLLTAPQNNGNYTNLSSATRYPFY
ncbi:MAG: hypothetical protein ACM3ZT_09015 [Bacillota bacterium]